MHSGRICELISKVKANKQKKNYKKKEKEFFCQRGAGIKQPGAAPQIQALGKALRYNTAMSVARTPLSRLQCVSLSVICDTVVTDCTAGMKHQPRVGQMLTNGRIQRNKIKPAVHSAKISIGPHAHLPPLLLINCLGKKINFDTLFACGWYTDCAAG